MRYEAESHFAEVKDCRADRTGWAHVVHKEYIHIESWTCEAQQSASFRPHRRWL